jgi:hypothetical protein
MEGGAFLVVRPDFKSGWGFLNRSQVVSTLSPFRNAFLSNA